MSRVISETNQLEFTPTGYDSNNSSYSSVSQSYPISNGYDGSTSNNYAYITCITGSRAKSYISYTFDVEGIPTNATIDNVTCTVKSRVSSTSYISTAVAQLYYGSTAKGSSISFRSTTASQRMIAGGDWTVAELSNIQVRHTATRGTSNTSRAAYIYFYGADLSITYSVNGTAYEITASSDVPGVTVNPSTQEILNGENGSVLISGDLTSAIVMDNGTDVTDQLFIIADSTINAVAQSETHESIQSGSSYAKYAVGRSAENPYSSTSNMYSNDTGYVDYAFDFSSIPEIAEITSVQVKVYGHRESSTIDSSHIANVQLMSGTALKGSDEDFTSTSNQTITISDPGTWTRTELQSAILRFTIGYYGGLVCGITWSVSYSVNGVVYNLTNVSADHTILVTLAASLPIRVKVNGTWVTPTKLLVKQNGTWVQSSNIKVKNNNTWN